MANVNFLFKLSPDNIEQKVFTKYNSKNLVHNYEYVQFLRACHLSVTSLSGYKVIVRYQFTDNNTISTNLSLTSLYESFRYFYIGGINNEGNSIVSDNPHNYIYKTNWQNVSRSNITAQTNIYANVVHSIYIPQILIGDRISPNSFHMYYIPLSATYYSTTANLLLNMNCLRFFDLDHNKRGPSLTVTSNSISAIGTSAVTVVIKLRPHYSAKTSTLFHRNTTINGLPQTAYSNTAYSAYARKPNWGLGAYIGLEYPTMDPSEESAKPYIDFTVYGGFSGHYLDLRTGKINNQTDTRFYLNKGLHNRLYDGNFHTLMFTWADLAASGTVGSYSANSIIGRVWLDGIEITDIKTYGSGRLDPVSFLVTGMPGLSSTKLCIASNDTYNTTADLMNFMPSDSTTYGELAEFAMYEIAISGSNSLFNPDDSSTFINADQANLLGLDSFNRTNGYSLLYDSSKFAPSYVTNATSISGNIKLWFKFHIISPSSTSLADFTGSNSNTIYPNDRDYKDLSGIPQSYAQAITGYLYYDTINGTGEASIGNQFAVLYDYSNNTLSSDFDFIGNGSYYSGVGKIYNNIGTYWNSETNHIGYIFYDYGNIIICNDSQDTEQTQKFVSSGTTSWFTFLSDTTNSAGLRYSPHLSPSLTNIWNVGVTDFTTEKEITRTIYSIPVPNDLFSKSRNPSSVFKGVDGKLYSKSNVKFISGISLMNSDGETIIHSKPSKPIIKKDNHNMMITFHVDI